MGVRVEAVVGIGQWEKIDLHFSASTPRKVAWENAESSKGQFGISLEDFGISRYVSNAAWGSILSFFCADGVPFNLGTGPKPVTCL